MALKVDPCHYIFYTVFVNGTVFVERYHVFVQSRAEHPKGKHLETLRYSRRVPPAAGASGSAAGLHLRAETW